MELANAAVMLAGIAAVEFTRAAIWSLALVSVLAACDRLTRR